MGISLFCRGIGFNFLYLFIVYVCIHMPQSWCEIKGQLMGVGSPFYMETPLPTEWSCQPRNTFYSTGCFFLELAICVRQHGPLGVKLQIIWACLLTGMWNSLQYWCDAQRQIIAKACKGKNVFWILLRVRPPCSEPLLHLPQNSFNKYNRVSNFCNEPKHTSAIFVLNIYVMWYSQLCKLQNQNIKQLQKSKMLCVLHH